MSCWILQCNPNKWCWFDAIRDYGNRPDTWGINPKINKKRLGKIKRGDIVFIWLSNQKGKGNRGIYAVAKITGLPDEKRKRFAWEGQYWIDKEEMERLSNFPRLEIRYTDTKLIYKPILKDDLEVVGLGDLLILRMPQGGIYELTEEECETIKKIVGTRQR